MLTVSNSRRTPHPYLLLLMLLLTKELCEEWEHAWNFYQSSDDVT